MINNFGPESGFLDPGPMNERREAFYSKVREAMFDWVNPDGTSKGPHKVFAGTSEGNVYPNREPFRCLPCLYTGEEKHIALANALVARYCSPPPGEFQPPSYEEGSERALQFGIFQSNNAAATFHKYRDLLTPEAAHVLEHHTHLVFEQRPGSAQIDFSFHGVNDNMPAMSTVGLVLGGEALGNEQAIAHGLWKLKRFRRLLARNAWCSEYNSGTYSGITLSSMAKLASESNTEEVRQLALEIEERLWAEMLLHWHPGTFCQAGPASRAYAVDAVNHMHNQHALMWWAFGEEVTSRNLIHTCFDHDGVEIVHFDGYQPSNIVEYVEMMDAELHVPAWLANLITERKYPARLKGTVEQVATSKHDGGSGHCYTTTYMEESFSLGTVDSAFCDGKQTNSLYATYRRGKEIASFKDSGVLFTRYLVNDNDRHIGCSTRFGNEDKPVFGETYIQSLGDMLTFQHDNTAILLAQPKCKIGDANCKLSEEGKISSLQLSIYLPIHYGKSKAVIVGDELLAEFNHQSEKQQPISIDTGGVYIHIDPLIASNYECDCAVELTYVGKYEKINLINYRGLEKTFTPDELARMLNGFVITLRSHDDFGSLEEFHKKMCEVRIQDYWAHLRYVVFDREDLEIEIITSVSPMSPEAVVLNGRSVEQPLIESNQIDVNKLPFLTGPIPRDEPFFPWKSLNIHPYNNTWGVGSTGTTSGGLL